VTNVPPEGEGTVIPRNAGNYLPIATTIIHEDLNLQHHCCENRKITRRTRTVWHSQRFPYYLFSRSVFSINLQNFPVISVHTL
jgi:hypothetical protein